MHIRTRTNLVKGSTDAALANSGVDATLSSPGLAALRAINSANKEIAVVVLDPDASAGAPEIVYVSSHVASATTATIQRAKEGTAFRAHASGTRWVHGPTKEDFELRVQVVKTNAEGVSNSTTLQDDDVLFFDRSPGGEAERWLFQFALRVSGNLGDIKIKILASEGSGWWAVGDDGEVKDLTDVNSPPHASVAIGNERIVVVWGVWETSPTTANQRLKLRWAQDTATGLEDTVLAGLSSLIAWRWT